MLHAVGRECKFPKLLIKQCRIEPPLSPRRPGCNRGLIALKRGDVVVLLKVFLGHEPVFFPVIRGLWPQGSVLSPRRGESIERRIVQRGVLVYVSLVKEPVESVGKSLCVLFLSPS